MTNPSVELNGLPVLVVGAGIMGAGIAQVAAQAGHPVWLVDARAGASAAAKAKLASTIDGLVAKGRLQPDEAQAAMARITPIDHLADARGVKLVVEAIFEDLAAKRALFAELEGIAAEDAVLATNTSSISVTAIGNGLQRPERLVGMHFFNPVPLMKLVEVVHGLRTDAAVADAIAALAKAWGKVPVHCKSTPGFIVNRIARPYYAEALALLHEQVVSPPVLDACLRGAGFRLGPCELMDLIGLDTNYAVTRSVYEANFYDKRYVPSGVQREMVEGGLFGRKSGHGFYPYPEGAPPLPPVDTSVLPTAKELVVHGRGPVAEALFEAATAALATQGWGPARETDSAHVGVAIDGAWLLMTDGRSADEVAADLGTPELALFDRPLALPVPPGTPLAYAVSSAASDGLRAQAGAWLAAFGWRPQAVADTPGLIVARTVAMLVNEAADAVQQGVCSPAGADAAMKLGVSYPQGPFEWLAGWGAAPVIAVLRALNAEYRGERYRVSPWLRRQAVAQAR